MIRTLWKCLFLIFLAFGFLLVDTTSARFVVGLICVYGMWETARMWRDSE